MSFLKYLSKQNNESRTFVLFHYTVINTFCQTDNITVTKKNSVFVFPLVCGFIIYSLSSPEIAQKSKK